MVTQNCAPARHALDENAAELIMMPLTRALGEEQVAGTMEPVELPPFWLTHMGHISC